MRMGPMFLRDVLAEKSQPVLCRPAAVQAILAPAPPARGKSAGGAQPACKLRGVAWPGG